MANRILSDEFQQRWISKIIPALENNVLMDKIWVLIQVRSQTIYFTFVDKFDGTTKCCIFDSLLVRQVQAIGDRWFFNVAFQPRPARKSIFASDCELRVTEAKVGVEDCGVCSATETRMKFPDSLGCPRTMGGTLF